jgi:hypothetical protein
LKESNIGDEKTAVGRYMIHGDLGGISKIYRRSKALINMRLSSGEGSCAGAVLPQ